jgi:hypothetical protein
MNFISIIIFHLKKKIKNNFISDIKKKYLIILIFLAKSFKKNL